jgi:hypothetical protein
MATYYTVRHGPSISKYQNRVSFNPYNEEAIAYQPYRTTPLILPGAKVKKENLQTESYLRHHPNPAVRANHIYEYQDAAMKQKVADTVLNRVVGEEAKNGKVVHKQFNSPIGLYSDQNIENTIKQTVPIFIDLSFLHQKQQILEQQKQQQNKYNSTYKSHPFSQVQPSYQPNPIQSQKSIHYNYPQQSGFDSSNNTNNQYYQAQQNPSWRKYQ